MKIYDKIEQGTEEWFALKLGKFSASKAQALGQPMKVNKKTGVESIPAGLETLCFEKAAEMMSGTREEGFTSADMERGIEQEEFARGSYELKKEVQVETVGFIELDDMVGASPDGMVEEDGLVEFKCQKNTKFIRTLYDRKIESKYVWQMQMQMYVADRKWVDFVVYNENFDEPIIIRVERDEEKIEKIKAGIEMGKVRVKEILEGCK